MASKKLGKAVISRNSISLNRAGEPREKVKNKEDDQNNPLNNEQVKSSPALKVWSNKGSKL